MPIRFLTIATFIFLFTSCPAQAASSEFSFVVNAPGEGVAQILASSPGSSWGTSEAEAAVATLNVDGKYNQDVLIDRGPEPQTYSVFLGPVQPGKHRLQIERSPKWSAAAAQLIIHDVKLRTVTPGETEYEAIAHAPIVYARADTLGHFSDVPLLMWYEHSMQGATNTLLYSVVFSNEDSGTPTDALMARWGRATDIEYIYRVTVGANRQVENEIFQGIEHDDRPFRGMKIGQHPLILVATPNNCFADSGFSPVQYHLLPVSQDLSQHSREELMDRFPWTYSIMAQELMREKKVRQFGASAGEAISDPRNYLYFEIQADNNQSGLVIWVKLKGHPTWYSSSRGRPGLVISRSGWYRTTVELPPGTRPESLEFIGLESVDLRPSSLFDSDEAPDSSKAESTLRNVSKVFFLDSQYRPGPNVFEMHRVVTFHPGDMTTFVPGASKQRYGSNP